MSGYDHILYYIRIFEDFFSPLVQSLLNKNLRKGTLFVTNWICRALFLICHVLRVVVVAAASVTASRQHETWLLGSVLELRAPSVPVGADLNTTLVLHACRYCVNTVESHAKYPCLKLTWS